MKYFFKPTKAKIIITLLIPFYLGVVAQISKAVSGSESIVTQSFEIAFLPFVLLLVGAISMWANNENFFDGLPLLSAGQKIWYFCLEIILPLLVNYLLACIIMYIYYRIKYHKKPKERSAEVPPE